jgi:hypothetical protein
MAHVRDYERVIDTFETKGHGIENTPFRSATACGRAVDKWVLDLRSAGVYGQIYRHFFGGIADGLTGGGCKL